VGVPVGREEISMSMRAAPTVTPPPTVVGPGELRHREVRRLLQPFLCVVVALGVASFWGGRLAVAGAPPRCRGRIADVVGTSGDDRITLRGDERVAVGLGGRDRIRGGVEKGHYWICGNAGNDRIVGGTVIHNHLFGGQGDDVISAPPEWRAEDHLFGGPGNDRLAGPGLTRFSGGSGDDVITGHGGYLMFGRSPGPVRVDLIAGTATGDGRDRFTGIWAVRGSAFGDEILGDDNLNMLWGGAGGDRIIARRGYDWVVAGEGDDIVRNGIGKSVVYAGSGSDALIGGAGNDSLYGGPGDDSVTGGKGDDRLGGGRGVDEATGGPGNDTCHAEVTSSCELT
jgi:Ca2+-binding RTX toxin-like protein